MNRRIPSFYHRALAAALFSRQTLTARCRQRLALASLVLVFLLKGAVDADELPAGFTSLFNGKDLSGWKATGKAEVWGAEKGILYVAGGGGGYLLTEEQFANFELRLEYKMPKMGNSGIALRSPAEGDPAYVGMEIQILDDANWRGLRPWQHTGSIYGVVPASKVNSKPYGEWNQLRIVAEGRKVQVEHNGETLVDANLDQHLEKHAKTHPGLRRADGHLGLQSYNFRVEFRKIYVKKL